MPYYPCIADMLSIPDGPLWIIGGWPVTAFLSYKWGRVAEQRNRKDAAQVAVISKLLEFSHNCEKSDDIISLRQHSIEQISPLVFDFSARVKGEKAEEIQAKLRAFRDMPSSDLVSMKIKAYEWVMDPDLLTRAREIFRRSIDQLKSEIESA